MRILNNNVTGAGRQAKSEGGEGSGRFFIRCLVAIYFLRL